MSTHGCSFLQKRFATKSINSFSDNHAHSYTEQQYTADKRCLQAGDNYFH